MRNKFISWFFSIVSQLTFAGREMQPAINSRDATINFALELINQKDSYFCFKDICSSVSDLIAPQWWWTTFGVIIQKPHNYSSFTRQISWVIMFSSFHIGAFSWFRLDWNIGYVWVDSMNLRTSLEHWLPPA